MIDKVPEYYLYLKWYDLYNPVGLYDFVQEMISNGIDLNLYEEIKTYYNIMCDNAFREEPNMTTVEYVVKKLRNALIRYGFAHTTRKLNGRLYYYWYERND